MFLIRDYKIKAFISLFLLLSLCISAASAEENLRFKSCTETEIKTIRETVKNAPARLTKLIQETRNYALTQGSISNRSKKQFKRALKNLECTALKLKRKIGFNCRSEDKKFSANADGAVIMLTPSSLPLPPISLSKVQFGSGFFYRNSHKGRISTLIHELSHKCGSSDGETYFVQYKISPNEADISHKNWGDLAPLYDWWLANGVCTPGIDCD